MYIKIANFTLLAESLCPPIEALAKLSKTPGSEYIQIKKMKSRVLWYPAFPFFLTALSVILFPVEEAVELK